MSPGRDTLVKVTRIPKIGKQKKNSKKENLTRIRTPQKNMKKTKLLHVGRLEERFNALDSLINSFRTQTIQLTVWPSCLIFLEEILLIK